MKKAVYSLHAVLLCALALLVLLSAFSSCAAAGETSGSGETGAATPNDTASNDTASDDAEKPDLITVCAQNAWYTANNGYPGPLRGTLQSLLGEDGFTLDWSFGSDYGDHAAENAAWAQHIRVEIAAGGGPDLFLLTADMDYSTLLFPDVEKVMRSSVFLPLDSYFEKSETVSLDDHFAAVMDAGCTPEGRMVVPLLFTVPCIVIDRETDTVDPDTVDSWEALENCDDLPLLDALSGSTDFNYMRFGPLVDYDSETLLITEDRLAEYAAARRAFRLSLDERGYTSDVLDAARDGDPLREEYMVLDRLYLLEMSDLPHAMKLNPGRFVLIPQTDDTGGVTAGVTVYAAINRNAKNPERCFKVIEHFLGEKMQAAYEGNSSSTRDVGSMHAYYFGGLYGIPTGKNSKAAELFGDVLERVTDAQFMTDIANTARKALRYADDPQTGAAEAITTMKMMLAE